MSSSSKISETDAIKRIKKEKKHQEKIQHKLEEIKKNHEGEKINNIDRYQLEISFLVVALVIIFYKIPITQPYFRKFIKLSNQYPDSEFYDISIDDLYFVFTWIFIITFIRAFSMTYILRPIAIKLQVSNHKSVQRFKEQGWYLIYYLISFPYGFYIYYNSDYFLQNDNLYINWPNDQMDWVFKSYYLIEMACWLQQIFILNIEAKRKDYTQMFSHHIITCFLVFGSYYYYFTKIGNLIMVMMDVVDIFLSLAKVLKYCGFKLITDILFGIFLVSWIILRHGVYNYILYHALTKSRDLMVSGRCLPGINLKRCYTDKVIDIFVLLLLGLQILMIIWMYLIIKVAVKVVGGEGADDVRSDSDDDE